MTFLASEGLFWLSSGQDLCVSRMQPYAFVRNCSISMSFIAQREWVSQSKHCACILGTVFIAVLDWGTDREGSRENYSPKKYSTRFDSISSHPSTGLLAADSFTLHLYAALPLSCRQLCQSSPVVLMGVADRWQSHFHPSVASCYLVGGGVLSHAIAISVTLNPSRGNGGWQGDRGAIHNCH